MLTVIGEALVDVVHQHDGETHAYPGGSPMNVAVGARRLGHPTNFVGHYGPDTYGESINAHLNASSVQLPFEPTAERTSVAQATIGADGAAEYEFDIEWALDAIADQLAELARTSDAVHTGSIAAMLEPGAQVVADAFEAARDSALLSYDPNCRPTLIHDVEQARQWAEKFVSLSSVVKASDEDLQWLYPDRSLADTARAWVALGQNWWSLLAVQTALSPIARSTLRALANLHIAWRLQTPSVPATPSWRHSLRVYSTAVLPAPRPVPRLPR